jgi:hypothetical protein
MAGQRPIPRYHRDLAVQTVRIIFRLLSHTTHEVEGVELAKRARTLSLSIRLNSERSFQTERIQFSLATSYTSGIDTKESVAIVPALFRPSV